DLGCRQLKVSLRGRDKLLKVARSIADLEGAEDIGAAHVAEALQYRRRDEERNEYQ
ncbi:MAG: ATP-dependent protease, partial [Firmicutes bacterium]|nr:ATP-dependent protease [Bacillota bacterium]